MVALYLNVLTGVVQAGNEYYELLNNTLHVYKWEMSRRHYRTEAGRARV